MAVGKTVNKQRGRPPSARLIRSQLTRSERRMITYSKYKAPETRLVSIFTNSIGVRPRPGGPITIRLLQTNKPGDAHERYFQRSLLLYRRSTTDAQPCQVLHRSYVTPPRLWSTCKPLHLPSSRHLSASTKQTMLPITWWHQFTGALMWLFTQQEKLLVIQRLLQHNYSPPARRRRGC